MADAPSPAAANPEKPKRRLGWSYLVVAFLAIAIFCLLALQPELPRKLLGMTPALPNDLGDAPTTAGEVSGKALADKAVEAELARIGPASTRAAQPATATTTAPATVAPNTAQQPSQPAATSFADEAHAAELLASAEQQYAAMAWDKAESTAAKIAALDAKPPTKGRAAEIALGAQQLRKLFKDLDDRDELSRNWDTHPSLVRLIQGGRESLAVPIVNMDEPLIPVADDPVGWLGKLKKQGKKAAFMLKGAKQFSKAELDLENLDIQPVDTGEVRARLSKQLDELLGRLKSDRALGRDPGAWYEAGKFAYRNRLDDRVTEQLDQALQLDPSLVRTVREGNAAALFGSLVNHMRNGNKQQAAAFMTLIERRYKDTDQGIQARLYYDGKTAELLVAAREADARARAEAEQRRQARLSAAKAKQDTAAISKIEQDVKDEAADAALDASAPPEIAQARVLKEQGRALLSEATNLPPTTVRNAKYHEAARILAQAKAAYAGYCQKNPKDDAAQVELVECQKIWFLANKSQTL